jgi:ribosomal protein L35
MRSAPERAPLRPRSRGSARRLKFGFSGAGYIQNQHEEDSHVNTAKSTTILYQDAG